MDQTKITKLLRLMKLLTGNVYAMGMAEKDLRREDGKWVLRTVVHSHEGVGRFVIGLAADVKILEGEGLKGYVKTYDKKYIQKIV